MVLDLCHYRASDYHQWVAALIPVAGREFSGEQNTSVHSEKILDGKKRGYPVESRGCGDVTFRVLRCLCFFLLSAVQL